VTPYLIGLALCVALVFFSTEDRRAHRVAIVLAGNFIANELYYRATGEAAAWWWFLFVDAVSAWLVLARPVGRVQVYIGFTYLVQIGIHWAYALVSDTSVAYEYWLYLTSIAWAQLVLLGGWAGHDVWRRTRGLGAVHRRVDPAHSTLGVSDGGPK